MNDRLLFIPSSATAGPIDTIPPLDQVQIFKLWQIYLEHVDPLLKVTHTPTLQPRIINSVSDLAGTDPALQALIFSICCMALKTIDENECQAMFQKPISEVLDQYQAFCRQALMKADMWRTTDLDCLTAQYLYLVRVT